jgi:hypothetical protein
MKSISFTICIMMLSTIFLYGQEKIEEPKFGISLSGFVKTDLFYDTRQVVSIREGHFLLYPENQKPDFNGKDINSKDRFNILSVQTRLTGKITGPDLLKAKTSAMIEADFFGNENQNFSDVNGLRLRHAIVRLNWSTTELMVGQYWHPLFVPECFPDVISFNTGAPFQPFSRNPQIRFTQKLNNFKLIVAAATQRDFISTGPDGPNPKYLSNSVLPDMNLHLQYSRIWDNKNEFLLGAGAEYKMLTPRLYSQADKNLTDGKDTIFYSGDDNVKSFAFSLYSKLRLKPVTIKAYAIYGSNLFDMVMLGGYAVKSVNLSDQGKYYYTPVKNLSIWTEIITNGKNQVGIFAGISKNLGTKDNNTGLYYSRGANIKYIYRVSPRIIINLNKVRIATELEYTTAQYGNADVTGIVDSDLNTESNLRLLLAFYHFF